MNLRSAAITSLTLAGVLTVECLASPLPHLKVSDNGRFLVTEDGKPFFWLGDTGWALVARARRDDGPNQPGLSRYFNDRAAKRFNVLQTVLVHFGQAGPEPNAYGQAPFTDNDFTRPLLANGPDNDYWDWADEVIDLAASRGVYVALLPVWLNSLTDNHPLVRDPAVAYKYGRFVGARYRQRTNIIWVLGGDPTAQRDITRPERLAMTRALAEGIADGVNGVDKLDGAADWSTTLMTFHPRGGGHSSSEVLHAEPWLDFNMIQTTTRFQFANYQTVSVDYAKEPAKPTLDGEVAYEDSLSLRKDEPQDKRTGPTEVRRAAYWAVFAGAFGHTYGHRSFISWIRDNETGKHGAHVPWYKSLGAAGTSQMTYLRNLMESRPMLTRVRDQSVLAERPPGGPAHAQATRDSSGAYAMVYIPTGKPVAVRLDRITGGRVRAWWFDPRGGTANEIGEFPAGGTGTFTPPAVGEATDWVLVIDDASKQFPPPGAK